MDNNIIKLSVLSSYCWIDPTDNKSRELKNLATYADFETISLKQIPPIKRRRLSGLSKLAMHSSLNCLEQCNINPEQTMTVFASQHGELNRTISIVKSMFEEHEVSPKDFSLSVHNASLGLFSIFTNNTHPGTSIAANSNTFGYALLESYNQLQRFPSSQVLLTCFDLEVGPPFSELQDTLYPSYSLSLLLSQPVDNQPVVSFSYTDLEEHKTPDFPLALRFFDFLHSDSQQQTIHSQDTRWDFCKHVL
ncbi:beta-ketoacyl synthase chain length factor [Kangiella sp.]|uniref:beta-ketoacyl synthase chain length factor n=1 Tax=Kangiella sp. TaxID=1920245 RepID=UPI003A90775D